MDCIRRDINETSQNHTTIKTSLAVKENKDGWGLIDRALNISYFFFGEIHKMEMTKEISWVLWWEEMKKQCSGILRAWANDLGVGVVANGSHLIIKYVPFYL